MPRAIICHPLFAALAVVSLCSPLWPADCSKEAPPAKRSTPQVAPVSVEEPRHDRGPAFVTVEYRIDPGRRSDFAQVMQEMRAIRQRDGSIQWELLNDIADPARFVEMFVLDSWVDHLRQHERLTAADREIEARVRGFHVGENPPVISHLIAQSRST